MPLYNGDWQLDNFANPIPVMDKVLTDCYFFYYSNCRNGAQCPYRHEPSALGHEVMCNRWLEGRCFNVHCKDRHMRIGKKRGQIQCFWENTTSGCTKPHCVFRHTKATANNNNNNINSQMIQQHQIIDPQQQQQQQQIPAAVVIPLKNNIQVPIVNNHHLHHPQPPQAHQIQAALVAEQLQRETQSHQLIPAPTSQNSADTSINISDSSGFYSVCSESDNEIHAVN